MDTDPTADPAMHDVPARLRELQADVYAIWRMAMCAADEERARRVAEASRALDHAAAALRGEPRI